MLRDAVNSETCIGSTPWASIGTLSDIAQHRGENESFVRRDPLVEYDNVLIASPEFPETSAEDLAECVASRGWIRDDRRTMGALPLRREEMSDGETKGDH